MKYALIHKAELVLDGFRICEVTDTKFEVNPALEWHEVSDDVVADEWYWNGTEALLVPLPEKLPQPTTSGTQTI